MRSVCIHCHFYQPPRENPWLEAIELQESAYPYHDWNERIHVECYAPNAQSRVLDEKGWIYQLSNNYARISFNFGATLLSWMEDKEPATYEAILEADRLSLQRFDGHGAAIAQVYNHVIMPLASRRDKETQVIWGLRDFESRFQRMPESMWLAETAVDMETLEVLAAHGMKYVILAPGQARRTRSRENGEWRDTHNASVNTRHPYLIKLPGGKEIAAFFYDGNISQEVAFGGLLHNGDRFATALMSRFSSEISEPQMVHIATDGETYGHHHRNGEMALSYALKYLEETEQIRITNYGEYLSRHPIVYEAEIHGPSAWSCAHGVERWRSNCGCGSAGSGDQKWRTPIRAAFDLLQRFLDPQYENLMRELKIDPWDIRNAYCDLVLDTSRETTKAFLDHWDIGADTDLRSRVLKALELQRHTLLMYTSCGWFFSDVSGIETVQNLKFAQRCVQLAEDLGFEVPMTAFRETLAAAKSCHAEVKHALHILDHQVKPSQVTLEKALAHYVTASLFHLNEAKRIYCYDIEILESERFESGRNRMYLGQAAIENVITKERLTATFGALYLGSHNFSTSVKAHDRELYPQYQKDMSQSFEAADFPRLVLVLNRYLGPRVFTLGDIFRDERKQLLSYILEHTYENMDNQMASMFIANQPLMLYLVGLGTPLPKSFHNLAEHVHNASLRKELAEDVPNLSAVAATVAQAVKWKVSLDAPGLGKLFQDAIERVMSTYEASRDHVLIEEIIGLIQIAKQAPFDVNLWHVQNRTLEWCHQMDRDKLRPLTDELKIR